jgi:methylmalonyl-CoA/ethylmalonyl-CoA epimerase
MRRYVDEYGIGPWAVYEFNPRTMTEMIVDDRPGQFAMRLANARLGRLYLELIEPLDDQSIHAKHLEEHGEGLHHVLLGVADYDRAEAILRAKGHKIIMGATQDGATFSYFSTEDALGFLVELTNVDLSKIDLTASPPEGNSVGTRPPDSDSIGGT